MFNSSQESSHSTKRHKDSSQGKNSRQSKNKSPALQDSPAFLKDLNSSPGPSNKITNNKSSKNNTRAPVSSEYKEEQNREYKGNNKQGFKIPKRLTQKDTAATKYKSRTPLENVRRIANKCNIYSVSGVLPPPPQCLPPHMEFPPPPSVRKSFPPHNAPNVGIYKLLYDTNVGKKIVYFSQIIFTKMYH